MSVDRKHSSGAESYILHKTEAVEGKLNHQRSWARAVWEVGEYGDLGTKEANVKFWVKNNILASDMGRV